jgi:hypothetical protein
MNSRRLILRAIPRTKGRTLAHRQSGIVGRVTRVGTMSELGQKGKTHPEQMFSGLPPIAEIR